MLGPGIPARHDRPADSAIAIDATTRRSACVSRKRAPATPLPTVEERSATGTLQNPAHLLLVFPAD
jgi:hypothetical protein